MVGQRNKEVWIRCWLRLGGLDLSRHFQKLVSTVKKSRSRFLNLVSTLSIPKLSRCQLEMLVYSTCFYLKQRKKLGKYSNYICNVG